MFTKGFYLRIILRSILIWTFALFSLTGIGILAMVSYPFRMYNFVHFLALVYSRSMLFVSGVRFDIKGKEKLIKSGPVIYVSNHQSMFDAVGMYMIIVRPFRWIAKASLFRLPILGIALKAGGYIPVERDHPMKAARSLLEAARKIEKGLSVVIFPEGTRSFEDGTMRPFKNGSFLLAKKAGVPVQPVVFWGSHKIIPVNRQERMQKIYPGKVSITIHDPIYPADYGAMDMDTISNLVYSKMENTLSGMRKSEEDAESIK